MSSLELASAKYFDDAAASAESPVKLETKGWTVGLTVICLLCGLFGLWGMGTSAVGVMGAVSGTEDLLKHSQSGQSAESLRQMALLYEQYRTPRIFAMAVSFILGILLIATGAMLFVKSPSARSTAVTMFGAVIGYHVCMAVLSCAMFVSASSTIESATRSQAQAHLSGQELDSAMSSFMGNVAFFALVATFVGLLIKAAIYGAMILHLNTPYVRAVFGENPYPEYDEMRKKVEANKEFVRH